MILGDKDNKEHPCKFPTFKIPKDYRGMPLCFQPIFWSKDEATQTSERTYTMQLPAPFSKQHWQGLFAELVFPQHNPSGHWLLDFLLSYDTFRLSSPGWVTPNSFPFEDCYLDTCQNIMV